MTTEGLCHLQRSTKGGQLRNGPGPCGDKEPVEVVTAEQADRRRPRRSRPAATGRAPGAVGDAKVSRPKETSPLAHHSSSKPA